MLVPLAEEATSGRKGALLIHVIIGVFVRAV